MKALAIRLVHVTDYGDLKPKAYFEIWHDKLMDHRLLWFDPMGAL